MAFGHLSSQRFGYAVHSVCYVARKPLGVLTTLPELAAWLRTVWPSTSETYLSAVIQRLARGGLLRSHRGVSGGYSLARSASAISLLDIAELLEGAASTDCSLTLDGACPADGSCGLHRKLRRLEDAYIESLARLSVAELAQDLAIPTDDKPQLAD